MTHLRGAQLEDVPEWVTVRLDGVLDELRSVWPEPEPLRILWDDDDPACELVVMNHAPGRRMKWQSAGVHIDCTCGETTATGRPFYDTYEEAKASLEREGFLPSSS